MLKIEAILNFLNEDSEVFTEIIGYKKKNDKEYKEGERILVELGEKLDKEVWLEIDEAVNTLEARIEQIAFHEGFNTAIRLIISSLIN